MGDIRRTWLDTQPKRTPTHPRTPSSFPLTEGHNSSAIRSALHQSSQQKTFRRKTPRSQRTKRPWSSGSSMVEDPVEIGSSEEEEPLSRKLVRKGSGRVARQPVQHISPPSSPSPLEKEEIEQGGEDIQDIVSLVAPIEEELWSEEEDVPIATPLKSPWFSAVISGAPHPKTQITPRKPVSVGKNAKRGGLLSRFKQVLGREKSEVVMRKHASVHEQPELVVKVQSVQHEHELCILLCYSETNGALDVILDRSVELDIVPGVQLALYPRLIRNGSVVLCGRASLLGGPVPVTPTTPSMGVMMTPLAYRSALPSGTSTWYSPATPSHGPSRPTFVRIRDMGRSKGVLKAIVQRTMMRVLPNSVAQEQQQDVEREQVLLYNAVKERVVPSTVVLTDESGDSCLLLLPPEQIDENWLALLCEGEGLSFSFSGLRILQDIDQGVQQGMEDIVSLLHQQSRGRQLWGQGEASVHPTDRVVMTITRQSFFQPIEPRDIPRRLESMYQPSPIVPLSRTESGLVTVIVKYRGLYVSPRMTVLLVADGSDTRAIVLQGISLLSRIRLVSVGQILALVDVVVTEQGWYGKEGCTCIETVHPAPVPVQQRALVDCGPLLLLPPSYRPRVPFSSTLMDEYTCWSVPARLMLSEEHDRLLSVDAIPAPLVSGTIVSILDKRQSTLCLSCPGYAPVDELMVEPHCVGYLCEVCRELTLAPRVELWPLVQVRMDDRLVRVRLHYPKVGNRGLVRNVDLLVGTDIDGMGCIKDGKEFVMVAYE